MKQLQGSLFVIALGCIVWLSIALVNAENQRNALLSGSCQDPVFKGSFEAACLATVKSRAHWWQHLGYALTHPRA